ncbi:MAG: GNAT family N-acetyltransferase, partial [Novosphingobium sp.]
HRQRGLTIGSRAALRLMPDIGPFTAVPDASEAGLAALLAAMDLHADPVLVVEEPAFALPPECIVLESAPLVQMVHSGAQIGEPDTAGSVLLGEDDWPEMARLAEATRPGPWRARTPAFGDYYGIRHEGALVAMAGQRMLPSDKLAEVSGVCTLPDHRGKGLAAKLIQRVMAGFAARGDSAFLHCNAKNVSAIRLYEALGFSVSREMVATVLTKA